jgi:hypothetical protein
MRIILIRFGEEQTPAIPAASAKVQVHIAELEQVLSQAVAYFRPN